MGAALYFCSVFDGREKKRVLKSFVTFFFNVLLGFCFIFFFLKGGVVPYVAGSQAGLFFFPPLATKLPLI
jgi:hypothetical protein